MRVTPTTRRPPLWQLLPLVGIGLYFGLYLVAAHLYPGGSLAAPTAPGFSWRHNYWCNLLQPQALNGAPNPARPVALSAMVLLGISLAGVWYQLPRFFGFPVRIARSLQVAGVLSMGCALFLFTPYHDLVLNVAGLLGTIAFAGTLVGLFQRRYQGLFAWGLANVGLIALNNFVYYTHLLLGWLPVLQKLTLVVVLLWLGVLNGLLYSLAPATAPQKGEAVNGVNRLVD